MEHSTIDRPALGLTNLYSPEMQSLAEDDVRTMIEADLAPIGKILSLEGVFTRTRDFGVIMDNVLVKVKHPALRVPFELRARWDQGRGAVAYRTTIEVPSECRRILQAINRHEFYGRPTSYGSELEAGRQFTKDTFARWASHPVFAQKEHLGVTSRRHRDLVAQWNNNSRALFNSAFDSDFERGIFLNQMLLLCQSKGLTGAHDFQMRPVRFATRTWGITSALPEIAEPLSIPSDSYTAPLVKFRASWVNDNGDDNANYNYDGSNVFIGWTENNRSDQATLI